MNSILLCITSLKTLDSMFISFQEQCITLQILYGLLILLSQTVLTHHNELYLIEVDSDHTYHLHLFLSGEVIHSVTGDYRIRKEMTEKGNYMLEMRKNNEFLDQSSTDDWTLGYAFYIEEVDEEKQMQHKNYR